jgi:hypothetical protein
VSHDITAILADPKAYGFEFVTENVRSGDMTFQGVPLLRVSDLAKFDAAFPGVALNALDGSSIRVSSQRVVREARLRNATIKTPEMQQKLVQWLLGIRTPTTRMVFAGPNGQAFSTEAEAKQAWLDWASQQ